MHLLGTFLKLIYGITKTKTNYESYINGKNKVSPIVPMPWGEYVLFLFLNYFEEFLKEVYSGLKRVVFHS